MVSQHLQHHWKIQHLQQVIAEKYLMARRINVTQQYKYALWHCQTLEFDLIQGSSNAKLHKYKRLCSLSITTQHYQHSTIGTCVV